MKLLVVDVLNPSQTDYRNPYTIGSFMLARQISQYPMFKVEGNKIAKQIEITSADCVELQKQVLEQLK